MPTSKIVRIATELRQQAAVVYKNLDQMTHGLPGILWSAARATFTTDSTIFAAAIAYFHYSPSSP